jgi:hypothetical protein
MYYPWIRENCCICFVIVGLDNKLYVIFIFTPICASYMLVSEYTVVINIPLNGINISGLVMKTQGFFCEVTANILCAVLIKVLFSKAVPWLERFAACLSTRMCQLITTIVNIGFVADEVA